jgi:hypothetical protein
MRFEDPTALDGLAGVDDGRDGAISPLPLAEAYFVQTRQIGDER